MSLRQDNYSVKVAEIGGSSNRRGSNREILIADLKKLANEMTLDDDEMYNNDSNVIDERAREISFNSDKASLQNKNHGDVNRRILSFNRGSSDENIDDSCAGGTERDNYNEEDDKVCQSIDYGLRYTPFNTNFFTGGKKQTENRLLLSFDSENLARSDKSWETVNDGNDGDGERHSLNREGNKLLSSVRQNAERNSLASVGERQGMDRIGEEYKPGIIQLNERVSRPFVSNDLRLVETKKDTKNVIVSLHSDGPDSDAHFMANPDAQSMAQNFASEHRIFLRAALELLTERENFAFALQAAATKKSKEDADNTLLKEGTLKKVSHMLRGRGVWKAKHVEVRTGFLTYYNESDNVVGNGDAEKKGQSKKITPLETTKTKCRAVKLTTNAMGGLSGYVFQLAVPGLPKRMWLAPSKEERHAWISVINEAMVGASSSRADNFYEYRVLSSGKDSLASFSGVTADHPYKEELEEYLDVQEKLKDAQSKFSYVTGLYEMWRKPLRIPVQWIRFQMEKSLSASQAFSEDSACSGIGQLWKDMLRDSASINGHLIKGDSGHGPERIIGALTKCIMDVDKGSLTLRGIEKKLRNNIKINESQAIMFARDVLLACNRTRSAGDSYYCVDTLCNNPNLVVLCPYSSEAEPLRINVEHAATNEDKEGTGLGAIQQTARSEWIPVRSVSSKKNWNDRFVVLSEGVISYYEKDLPKPQKLRGQLVLSDILRVETCCEEDPVRPDSTSLLRKFRRKKVIRQVNAESDQDDKDSVSLSLSLSSNSVRRHIVTISCKDDVKRLQLKFDHEMEFRDWIGYLQDSINTYAPEFQEFVYGEDHVDLQVDDDDSVNEGMSTHFDAGRKESNFRGNSIPTVEINLEASTVYKICTTDPQGDEREDTWATLQTKFVQCFRLCGGPCGRIMRGEEIVQMLFLQGLADGKDFDKIAANARKKRVPLGSLMKRTR